MSDRFFDVHIHLTDFDNIKPDVLMSRLKKAGVAKCVCVSAHRNDWAKVAKLAHDFPFEVVPAFGLHPWYVGEATNGWKEELAMYLDEFPESVIGECGFDRLKRVDFEAEKEVFEVQLDLANEKARPLIIHSVKADEDMQKYDAFLPEKSIFHSFSSSKERLNKILKFVFYISVNKRFFSKGDSREILISIPLSRLLIETDAPYQSDVEDLKDVVSKIAEIKQSEVKTIEKELYLNAVEVLIND